MAKPVLVVMAAGMGSRYGGLKQLDPLNEQGEVIMDFSLYDALRAGFEKVVFIIRREWAQEFEQKIGKKVSKYMEVAYVYQDLADLPEGYQVPQGRQKPWGTAHAVLSCRKCVQGPFTVINADDYYGPQAFSLIYQELLREYPEKPYHYAMIGYQVENTVTEAGSVSRGVCRLDEAGKLLGIEERKKIEKHGQFVEFTEDEGKTWEKIPAGSTVSMNFWGFQASMLAELNARFPAFLDKELSANPLKCEYLLPGVVGELLTERKAEVSVIPTIEQWYGMTYQADKPAVSQALQLKKQQGLYPEILWK